MGKTDEFEISIEMFITAAKMAINSASGLIVKIDDQWFDSNYDDDHLDPQEIIKKLEKRIAEDVDAGILELSCRSGHDAIKGSFSLTSSTVERSIFFESDKIEAVLATIEAQDISSGSQEPSSSTKPRRL